MVHERNNSYNYYVDSNDMYLYIVYSANSKIDKNKRIGRFICYQLGIIENGADISDSDIKDSTITGCMIFAEPGSAKRNVEDYIKNRM